MALDLHVRIDIHPRRAPLGIDIGLEREGLKGRAIHRLELGLPTAGELLKGARVEALEASGERRVQLGQTEEGPMAQPGQHPPLHEQDARFDLGLVTRFAHPSWDDRDAVVVRERRVGGVQLRLIATGLGHARAQIVRDHDLRHPAEKGEGPHVRPDPIGQRLRPGRLRVGVIRRALSTPMMFVPKSPM